MEKLQEEEEKKFTVVNKQKSIDSESYKMSVSNSLVDQQKTEDPVPILVKSKWLFLYRK